MEGPKPTTDQRSEPPNTADERTLLTAFLDWRRETLVRKCAGLSNEQLRLHAVPSSKLTLIGLVRHLAVVEWWWLQNVIAGEHPPEPYCATGDRDEDFNDIGSATGESACAIWRAQVEQSRRMVTDRSLDAESTHPSSGAQYSLRQVLTHMIEEYARHNGHADLIREAIDGEVGE